MNLKFILNFQGCKNLYNYPNYKIPIYKKINTNGPNFIILSSGQSNAGGWGSFYEHDKLDDKINENIFSYNGNIQKWVVSNLLDESLESLKNSHIPGCNLFAFQFAKKLIKDYPGIRPGIINICEGGRPISLWAKFNNNEQYYDEYIRTLNIVEKKTMKYLLIFKKL